MHKSLGHWSLNYLDDFTSAELQQHVWKSFFAMGNLLKQIGADEAPDKACAPSTRMEFLGNTFDTKNMTIEISPDRIKEITKLLDHWLQRQVATRKQLESIIGKLSFVANCVRVGRVFISRLIAALSAFSRFGVKKIMADIRKDLLWWRLFMIEYNGVSLLWLHDTISPDIVIVTDSSLDAAGAICNNEFFHARYPEEIKTQFSGIGQLEMLAIILAIKMWTPFIQGKFIRLTYDNEACVQIVKSGKSRDKCLQMSLRELNMILARNDSLLKLVHIFSKDNKLPDKLSRWYILGTARRQALSLTRKMKRRTVMNEMYHFEYF